MQCLIVCCITGTSSQVRPAELLNEDSDSNIVEEGAALFNARALPSRSQRLFAFLAQNAFTYFSCLRKVLRQSYDFP